MEVPHLGFDKVPFILSVVYAFTALRHLGYPQAGVGIADNTSPRIFGLFFFFIHSWLYSWKDPSLPSIFQSHRLRSRAKLAAATWGMGGVALFCRGGHWRDGVVVGSQVHDTFSTSLCFVFCVCLSVSRHVHLRHL